MAGIFDRSRPIFDRSRPFVEVLTDQQIPFKSASISFYFIASIVPFTVLVLALFSLFGATDLLVSGVRPILPENGKEVLTRLLQNSTGRRLTSGLGLLGTFWSASRLFRALSIAFTDIYQQDAEFGFLTHLVRSLLVLVGLLFAIVLLATTSVVLSIGTLAVSYPTVLGNAAALVVLAIVFFPFYYVLPPKSVTATHAIPGTLLAATGWVLLQFLFFSYAHLVGPDAAFSVLGGVILFVSFLYLAAMILLVGAIVNAWLDWE